DDRRHHRICNAQGLPVCHVVAPLLGQPGPGRTLPQKAWGELEGQPCELRALVHRERAYAVTNRGVPSGRRPASLVMPLLVMRMQPWLTGRPMLPGASVPCTPTLPFPPMNEYSTSENAEVE